MAAPARTARWRITLQASASSSGCGAININRDSDVNSGTDIADLFYKLRDRR
jgi:hypothetical protein